MADKLVASKTTVRKTLQALPKSGLLDSSLGGGWYLRIDRLTNKLVQKIFIKASLSKTAERIERDYGSSKSLFIDYTFSPAEERLARLQIEIREVMEKYPAENPPVGQEQVASSAFQFFPYQRQP